MTQTTPLRMRPKPAFDWSDAPHRRKRALPLQRVSLFRQVAMALVLMLLCALYLGPLQADATAVLAVKKVLPVYSVEREDKVISVTFDASWGGDKTLAILDLLDAYNCRATFFLVGIWVDKYPDLVQEIHRRGHEIGNHSDTHPYMTQISEGKMRQELQGMSEKIEGLIGVRPTLFRPPYGDYNNKVITICRDEGYEAVQWSVDSLDWKNRGVEDLVRRATSDVQKGDIILFHNDSEYIVQALPRILSFYADQGFSMIPAGEILLQGATTIDVQGKQHPAAAD